MDRYGYVGGGNLYGLGSREYVQSFFKAIDKYVFNEKLYRKLDWSLITDRLYKRTISEDMLDVTLGTMARLMHLFRETPLSKVDWNALGIPRPDPMPAANTEHEASLRDLYLHFEFGFACCASSYKFDSLYGANHAPLRIGNLSPHHYVYHDMLRPEAYEELGPKDLPFWLRDDIEYPDIPVTVIDGNTL